MSLHYLDETCPHCLCPECSGSGRLNEGAEPEVEVFRACQRCGKSYSCTCDDTAEQGIGLAWFYRVNAATAAGPYHSEAEALAVARAAHATTTARELHERMDEKFKHPGREKS